MPFRGLTMLKSRKLVIKGGLCYRFAMVSNRQYKSTFQILTQEDWNIVLFAGMERTTHWAALYFVLLMTFGNYVLFNLLVAILVEGFSKQDELFDRNEVC